MSDTTPENLKKRVKESYDAIAETYASQFTKADDPIRLGFLRTVIKHVHESGKDIANVLELGCGAGIPATKFLLQNDKPAFHITGNDISTTQLKLARSNLANYKERLTLTEGDMLSLDFPVDTFDVITGFYSIIHLPRDEQTQLMHKISKWLKPDGLFLANFGVDEIPVSKTENWLDHKDGWMFWSGWGKEGSLKMVESVGMEILIKEEHQDTGDSNFVWVLAKNGA